MIGTVDRYKGMEITDIESLADTEQEFEEQLNFNMKKWI